MNEEYAVNSHTATTTATSGDVSPFPFLDMGTHFVIGLAVGYFMKKFFKLLLIFLGLGLVALFVLESQGVSTVNEEALTNGVSQGVDSFKGLTSMLQERLSSMKFSSGVGAVAGFFAGLKFG